MVVVLGLTLGAPAAHGSPLDNGRGALERAAQVTGPQVGLAATKADATGRPHDAGRFGALRVDVPETADILPPNAARYGSVAGLGSAGEPFGTTSPRGCRAFDGKFYGAGPSRWYRFTGTGAEVFLHTLDNALPGLRVGFDTFLAVYRAGSVTEGSVISCRVSLVEDPVGAGAVFMGQAGTDYLIQVAGADTGRANVGSIPIRAITSDLSAHAMPLPLNTTALLTNLGTVDDENRERLVCEGSTYSATLWMSFEIPVTGTVTFTATSSEFDPSATIVRPGDITTPVVPCSVGVAARTSGELPPGRYLVQVGATNGVGGNFTYDLRFTEDVDVDNDGIARPPAGGDCDDRNGGIRPGAPDVNNELDDDCDGVVDPDRDGDAFLRPQDCNDADAAIRPGTLEIRGNRVDENCDGRAEPFSRISSRVQVGFRPARTTRVTRLNVLNVPANATIAVSCRGGGCPRSFTQRLTKARRSHSLIRRFRRARLRPRAVLEVRVTAARLQGRRFRYEIRRNRRPLTASSFIGTGFQDS